MYRRHSEKRGKGRPPHRGGSGGTTFVSPTDSNWAGYKNNIPTRRTFASGKSTGEDASALSLMKEATIPIFSVNGLTSPDKPTSFNDDLRIGSFRPIRYTWAGEQRKGIAMHIMGASSIDGHLRKATKADFFLPKEIPLPPEVARSVRIIAESGPKALRAWWELQLDRVKGIVNCAADLQTMWNDAAPTSIKSATGRLQRVAHSFILKTFDLGGGKWDKQFIYGSPLVGDLPPEGVYARDTARTPAQPLRDIWQCSQERFANRGKKRTPTLTGSMGRIP